MRQFDVVLLLIACELVKNLMLMHHNHKLHTIFFPEMAKGKVFAKLVCLSLPKLDLKALSLGYLPDSTVYLRNAINVLKSVIEIIFVTSGRLE